MATGSEIRMRSVKPEYAEHVVRTRRHNLPSWAYHVVAPFGAAPRPNAAFAAALFPMVVSVVKHVITSTLQRERSQLRDRRRCGSTSSQNQSPQRVGG